MAKAAKVNDETSALPDDIGSIIELDANLTDIEEPKELPAGKYKAEVQDVQVKTSQAGNRYFAIQFRVPHSEIPADISEEYEDGALLFYNRVIVPRSSSDRRALYNLRKFIEAIGLNSKTTTIDTNEWMGREVRLHTRIGKDQNNEPRAEVSAIEAVDDSKPRSGTARR